MGSPADCAFDFRQSHLNMIRESRWLGAAGGKHCGDAGLAQCCQLPPAAQRVRPLLRRKVQGDGDLQPGSAKLCDYKQAMSALLRLPSLTYGGQSQCSPE